MIVIKIVGGLGNQMFQYAFGKSLALEYQAKLFLDISAYKTYKKHEYCLKYFDILEQTANHKLLSDFPSENAGSFRKWFGKKYHGIRLSESDYNNSNTKINPQKQPVYLDGFWQNHNHFSKYKKEISAILTPNISISSKVKKLQSRIKKENSVSVHIRRGDYVTNLSANDIHGVLSVDYFKAAIELIEKTEPNTKLYFFSDDIEWVKKQFSTKSSSTFVSGNTNVEDLELMRTCKHNIIANSSFSWWAAWLNSNPHKKVIIPDPWFKNKETIAENYYPEDWFKLSADFQK